MYVKVPSLALSKFPESSPHRDARCTEFEKNRNGGRVVKMRELYRGRISALLFEIRAGCRDAEFRTHAIYHAWK